MNQSVFLVFFFSQCGVDHTLCSGGFTACFVVLLGLRMIDIFMFSQFSYL